MALKLPYPVLNGFPDAQQNFDKVSGLFPVAAANLADGSVTATKLAPGAATPAVVVALPGTPYDGQEISYLADAVNGIVWTLKYRSASVSAYKWEFVGGGPLFHEIDTTQTTASTTFVDLATVGPTVTAPLAGDYEIAMFASMGSSAAGAAPGCAVKFGAAATSDTDGFGTGSAGVGDPGIHMGRVMVRNVATAGTVLKMQYRTINAVGTMLARRRNLLVRPVRVG